MTTRHNLVFRCLLVLSGLCLALLASEGALRLLRPYATWQAATELPQFRRNAKDVARYFVVDPAMGFRPVLGNDAFNTFGTVVNSYPLEIRPQVERLLFLGDSVTRRAKIIKSLRALYGKDRYEDWNAGVESFNTVQELAFYKAYNRHIRPDHVILFFHNAALTGWRGRSRSCGNGRDMPVKRPGSAARFAPRGQAANEVSAAFRRTREARPAERPRSPSTCPSAGKL
jgi:hypothetical protein